MKLVIIAGGKGTRLGLNDIPKPMVDIGGKPLLELQIANAKAHGITEVYILTGYLAAPIKKHFGTGIKFGVNISYIEEDQPLGTAGAIKQLEGKVRGRFLVFYGDVMINMDLSSLIAFDGKASSIATIVVHPNDHPHDSDLINLDGAGRVLNLYSKPHVVGAYYPNLVNAGAYILSEEVFKYIKEAEFSDFGRTVFPSLLQAGETIRGYKTAEYLKDIGTPERLEKVRKDWLDGSIQRRNKAGKRPAIFMDRDGTLIEDVDLLCKAEDLKLFAFSAPAIKKINNSDFLLFLVTNQPVVARNLCDLSAVRGFHNKLETLLGEQGVYLTDIYVCPHHPDKGYPGENAAYKIDCGCRKPKTGMIDQAVLEYNVDLTSSWFIGDTTIDIQTGINAGTRTVLVKTGKGGKDGKYNCAPHFTCDNLALAVDYVLNQPH